MKKIGLFLMAVLVLAACNSNSEGGENSELKALDKQAMDVHDVAMKFSLICRYRYMRKLISHVINLFSPTGTIWSQATSQHTANV